MGRVSKYIECNLICIVNQRIQFLLCNKKLNIKVQLKKNPNFIGTTKLHVALT